MRTVAIMNQKGGCGKTTTAINLAGALARRGRPTLLVDLDPQSHCAAGLSVPEAKVDLSSADLLLAGGERSLDETRLLWTAARHLELAPSTVKLAGLEAPRGGLADQPDRETRLSAALARLADRFEFCVIDCPPSIGLLTFNAMHAADELIIPVETAFLSMHGAQRQVQTVRSLGRRLGAMTPYAVLATMHNAESSMARSVLAELRRAFGERMIPAPIRLDVKLREAVSFGQPVVEYAPTSWGAEDYTALAEWLEAPRHNGSDRARDLADRARRLLSRSAEIQERISRARGVHLAPDPEPRTPPRKPTRRPTELYGVRETARGALFVHPADRDATVAIAADFNGWSASATPMTYNERLGVHEACVPLEPGTYEYRLVIDGTWIADPFNIETRSNPYGGTNSRFVIRGARAGAHATSSAEGSD